MATEVPTHAHEIMDEDRYFTIDPITKKITAGSNNLTLAQHSKNSERFTFYIPAKTIEGHDMSICNQVLIHFQNIDQETKSKSLGIYKVTDLKAGDDSVTLSWLVDDEATVYAGGLIFSIHFACIAEDGTVVYNFPTLTNSQVTVGETVWNSETIAREHPDIISEFDGRISAMEAGGYLPAPAKAAVGQYFRVKAVDESGKVTEVETVQLNMGDPVDYLYNSLRLPDIYKVYTPQLQAQYPGAFIVEYEADVIGAHYRSASLYLVPKVEYTKADNGNWCVSLENGYKKSNIQVSLTGEATDSDYAGKEWGPLEDETGLGLVTSEIDWANFDVRSEDGTVCLAASEPVAVRSGADSMPTLIDLDTYGGETSLAFTLVSLVLNGGGEQEDVELGDLFADLSTDRPIRIKIPILSTATSILVDGVSTVRTDGQAEQLGFHIVINNNGVLVSAIVFITANGVVAVRVSQM